LLSWISNQLPMPLQEDIHAAEHPARPSPGAEGNGQSHPSAPAKLFTTVSRLFLSEILVDTAPGARAIVTFGDSITDGNGSAVDANHRWPDLLAQRLAKAGGAPIAVLNEGISGAKVLSDRMGTNALARFDRDVLAQPHADTVVDDGHQ
jgi:lysophospholipase L1-like esterase